MEDSKAELSVMDNAIQGKDGGNDVPDTPRNATRKFTPDEERFSSTSIVAAEVTNIEANKDVENPPSAQPSQGEITYIKGWRFYVLAIGIGLSILAINMEISIISTSLVTITNDFRSFKQSSWVIAAYLSTYTGFMIIWSKFSDFFGIKWTYILANFMYLAFSAGCGASQSMLQLIICRAFQGVGASGCFSVSLAIFYNIIPRSKYPFYGSLISSVTTASVLCGPLLGGLIDTYTTWRWIFYINVPGVGIIIAIMSLLLPAKFPYHGPQHRPSSAPNVKKNLSSILEQIDFFGTFLLLGGSLLLITPLLGVNSTFTWSSPVAISLLTISAIFWVVFVAWEWFLGTRQTKKVPIVPWQMLTNRLWMGIALTSFLVGIPSTVITISLPQKYQAVYGDTPFQAGYRLIAFTVLVPFGSIVFNTVLAKTRIPPIFLLFFGSILQTVGTGLLLTIPVTGAIPGQIYFFEVLVAIGVGGNFALLVVLNPHAIEKKYIGTASGALVQFRMTGATIGLSACTTVFNSYLTSHLPGILSNTQLTNLLQSISTLETFTPDQRQEVEVIYGNAYYLQLKVLLGFTLLQIPVIFLIWKSPQLGIHKK